jgi:tRNA G10  N-methylase Trm11
VRRLPLDAWQERWRELQELPGNEMSVSVLRRGEHNYSYEDVQERALEVLAEVAPAKVTLEPRQLELRIEIAHDRCRLTGRLTPRPLSERPYKRYRAQGDTDPTLAAAMVRLSAPTFTDLFLDPFCGIGTIPIERALWGKVAAVAAGENKEKRVAWAMANAELASASASFACWDAFALPFADRAFSRLVTSPPQSDPVSGQPWQPGDFARLLAESLRVLQYGGVSVWLLERGPLFKMALKSLGLNYPVERLACSWKGRSWTIYTLQKVL